MGDGFRRVILAIGMLFAIGIIGTRWLFLHIEYDDAIAKAEGRTRDTAVVLEENVKKQFGMAKLVSDAAIRDVHLMGGVAAVDTYEAHSRMVELAGQMPAAARISVFDATGRMTVTSTKFPTPEVLVGDREWWNGVAAGGKDGYVGELILGRVSNDTILPYARRIIAPDGTFLGAVLVSIYPERLQDVYASTGFAENLLLAMWRSDGRLLARTPAPPGDVGKAISNSQIFRSLAHVKAATLREPSPVDGQERILSFRRLDTLPVLVVAGMTVDDALADWRKQLTWSVLIALFALVGFGSLTAIGLRLRRREEAAQAGLVAANAQLVAAANAKEMLFREVYHRTKNNMMMVISLLELQSMRFTDPLVRDAFTNTEERLRAMSMVYEALYRREGAGSVDIQEYLEALVASLAHAYGAEERGIRFTVDIRQLLVEADKAVPLALAINEAVTNAFKHAFPAGRGGAITITSRHAGGLYTVVVADDGIGFSGQPSRDSLGLKIIQSMARQLTAQYRVEHGADGSGTRVIIDFPA